MTAAAALAFGLANAPGATATADTSSTKLAAGVHTTHTKLAGSAGVRPMGLGGGSTNSGAGEGLPSGVPSTGSYTFLLKLGTPSTGAASANASTQSQAAADGRAQLAKVTAAQNAVIAKLPSKTSVLYKLHALMAGVAVTTHVSNYQALTKLPNVTAVYPIAPKSHSNSYAVPLQGGPAVWAGYGDLGANSTVAVIDTGIDYTHANFGGEGTTDAYDTAKALRGRDDADFPTPGGPAPTVHKVIGGYDLAGDDYDADGDLGSPTPTPDPYPLDCNGHGSHVSGTVAGYGENANGTTYTGAYDNTTPFDTMRIGPGMAPQAKLYAIRVFGCEGTTNLVAEGLDRADDPNQDGSTADHIDVVNMSLGSNFGSPNDGDSVVTDAASAAGVTVVVSSGNAGDIYDVGGSPGASTTALTVAASTDNYAQVDALNVSAPPSIAGSYGAERSIAYPWDTTGHPDLSGTVVRVSDPNNLDGCDPLSDADKAAVSGNIAFVEWTDLGTRRCGSVARGTNLANAGASGFIFGDDTDAFTAGITGSEDIPGVLLAKTGADKIRTELQAGHTVTISGTTKNGFRQILTGHDDQLAGFSSRGIGASGHVKPDVAAVGESVFSTASGTGNEGTNDSGTSMAAPMTAGAAALVHSQHTGWTPEQVKADIMNTAGQDIYVGANHTGDKYAPERVGSGRIQVKRALDNHVLAYNATDHGAASVSFGSQAASAPTTLTKTITVQNTTATAATYATSYDPRTTVPGATYAVTPASVDVGPHSTATVTVTLTLDPAAMTKPIDPTVAREQTTNGNPALPRVYQAEASGLVLLTRSGHPQLRVPVYSAPRPASTMTQASTLSLSGTASQTANLALTGTGFDNGTGEDETQSLVAGFEESATDGTDPVDFADEKMADVRSVGVTSDANQVQALGGDPLSDGTTYFAVQADQPWRTGANNSEFDIYIDTNGDGDPDFVTFNTRLDIVTDPSDVQVAETIDLSDGSVADIEPLNSTFGDVDTALLDSNVEVLPVATSALGLTAASSRISYEVDAFSDYAADPIDVVGDVSGSPALGFDPLHPGVAAYGTLSDSTSTLLFADQPSTSLKVVVDSPAYAADHGLGLMMVHFHNAADSNVQTVALTEQSSTTVAFNPSTIGLGASSKATVTVAPPGATGTVTLTEGSTTVGSGPVGSNGTVSFTVTPATTGTHTYTASYAGDSTHGASSGTATLTVTSSQPNQVTPLVELTAKKHTVKVHHKVKTEVTVTGTAGIATGTVELGKIKKNGEFKVLATGTLSNGSVKLVFKASKKGTYHLQARYSGSTAYTTASSGIVKVKVKKKHHSHR